MGISFNTALGLHEQALYLRSQRNDVLAANIANADTPGYQARDIDFRSALQQAAGQRAPGGTLALAGTQQGVSIGTRDETGALSGGDLKYRVPQQSSVDGNTVEEHIEQAAFADNAVRYQATLTFLGGKFSSMKTAITGGR